MNTPAESDTEPIEEILAQTENSEAPKEPAQQMIDAEAPEPKKPENRRQKKKKPRAKKGNNSLKQVSARFAACGRCSFFWAGYKVIFGESAQETAVAQSESGWLNLEWNSQMHELLFKSYGIRLDQNFYHYEGCCKECRRRFVYQASDSEDEPSQCEIEISPHSNN